MTKLHELYDQHGQSIWLDTIGRDLLNDGTLRDLVEKGLRGVTSNPTIFDKAISGSPTYDADIARLVAEGAGTFGIYDALSRADVTAAADLLRPVYDASDCTDGYVNLEVSPELAYDSQGTIAEARRLWAEVNRPNLMVKVPATAEGIPVVRQLTSEGINITATLLFSLQDYTDIAYAYIGGIEKLVESGGDPSRLASAAAFFVSRIDGVVDKQLTAAGNSDLQGFARDPEENLLEIVQELRPSVHSAGIKQTTE